jgi:triacylglycerol esterase/lipase EstA (alpha/beta hydrolase family)
MVTAIALDLLLLAGLGLYGWWAAAAFARGTAWWFVLLVPLAAYLALFVVVTLAWFALAWIWRTPRPAEARIDARGTLRLFWNELVTLMGSARRMGIAWWWMREPAPARNVAPVLLLHGVLCNSGVWLRMRTVLRAARNAPIYTLSYGPPLDSVERFADQLARRIERIRADTGAARVAIVAHSMGGIVARAYLRRYGAAYIDRVITIGTPHHGSVHAWLFAGISLAQLRPGNAWLATLNAAPLPPVRIVSIWSWHDSMVAPQASAVLHGAVNIAVSGVAHNAILRDRDVAALVIAELARPADQAAGAAQRVTSPKEPAHGQLPPA